MYRQFLKFLGPLAGGLLYFMLLMGVSQGLVALNASASPSVPWFPIPALTLIAIVTFWVKRRWEIRLVQPAGRSRGTAYTFACLTTYAAICVSVLEGAYHGLVQPAPLWPDENVSTAFQLSFLLVLPLIASLLAEIGFRGIIQTRYEKLLPLWPMLLLIAVINALMHFYDPEQSSQWLRFIALNLSFGYVTWRTQSILPALVAHILMNVFEPLVQYLSEQYGPGPVAFGDFSSGMLLTAALSGLMAFSLALYIGRSLRRPV
jgi:membrane protease YdiL (CAAX protease family)